MLNLLKYEWKKRRNLIITKIVALVAFEGAALYTLNKGNVIMTIFLSFLMFIGAILMAFLDVAIQYYNDFKKSQGTLLFLTPNKGNKIIGSKMIFGALELITGMAIVTLFIFITNAVAVNMGYAGIAPEINNAIAELGVSFGVGNTWWIVTGFLLLVFLQYFTAQAIAILSITLGRTILSRNNYNWLWAVLLFIATNVAIQTVNSTILLTIGLGDGWLQELMINGDIVNATIDVSKFLIIGGIEYLVWIVVAFFASSRMLNKRIDI